MSSVNKLKKELNNIGIDAILISNPYNMRYLSGFSGGEGYLYISNSHQVVITDFRYTFQANSECKDFDIIEIGEGGYAEVLAKLTEDEKVQKIGFEAENLSVKQYHNLKSKLICDEWIPFDDIVDSLRTIKSSYEIECMKSAQKIADSAFKHILTVLKPGISELSVAAEIEYYMKNNGAEGLSFDTIVASGINSSMPHATPSRKVLEVGDFVTMDFGCVFNGYCSDMTRTVVIGKASDEQKKIYNTVFMAQKAALNYIHAGVKGSEVDKVARDIIENAGYHNCFGHGLGHSVGLFIHENPRLSAKDDSVILAGTIETVEPGIYVKDFGGVRIEDIILVTEKGYENFTTSEKELIELY